MLVLYFCLFLQFIFFNARFSDANPLIGKNIQATNKDEFPFIVSLSNSCNFVEKENHFCGGTLISKRHVLTSAHCILDVYLSCVSVIVGSIDFESGQTYKVGACVTYDEWAEDNNITPEYSDNDLAIIILSTPVKEATPGVISKMTKEEVVGKKVVTAGWGVTDESTFSRPRSLQKAYLKTLTRKEYERNALRLNITDPMPLNVYFTSVNPPAVLTCGDSGGPLILVSNNKIVGINDSICKTEQPQKNRNAMSRHMALDCYREFIESVIKNY